jgi:hypothetical protein
MKWPTCYKRILSVARIHSQLFAFITSIFLIEQCPTTKNELISLTLHHPAARQFCRSTYIIRILLSSNSAVLINITGVSPPHFDFVVYLLCSVSMLRNFHTIWHEYNNIPFWTSTTNVFPKSRIKFFFLTLISYTVSMVHMSSHLIFPIKYVFLYKTRRQ